MLNPNNNPVINNPNQVNPNAPHYYQMFATDVKIVAKDCSTGENRQYDLKSKAARDKLNGKRRTLSDNFDEIGVECNMREGVHFPVHGFNFVFDNWQDVLALLHNTLWLS